MAEPRLTLDQALARVEEQFHILDSMYRNNPDERIDWPADIALLNLLKAAKRHVRKSDPAWDAIDAYELEYKDRRPMPRVGQLLPVFGLLRQALRDKMFGAKGGKQSSTKAEGPGGGGNGPDKQGPAHLPPRYSRQPKYEDVDGVPGRNMASESEALPWR